jgi:hypothetical protein
VSAWLLHRTGFLATGDQVGLGGLLGPVPPGGTSARTPADTTSRSNSQAKRDPIQIVTVAVTAVPPTATRSRSRCVSDSEDQ